MPEPTSGADPLRSPREALVAARKAVADFTTTFLGHGNPSWPEETATIHLLMAAYPSTQYALFNHQEERRVGADWLWWFCDPTGEAFGILVQAKNLKRDDRKTKPPAWSIDFGYRDQMQALRTSASYFQVPAAYTVYCGDRRYRASMSCTANNHPAGVCVQRDETAVTVLPALLADTLRETAQVNKESAAVDAVHQGMPLEHLADGAPLVSPRLDMHFGEVGPQLQAFLREEQHGARLVARKVFQLISDRRGEQFSLAASTAPAPYSTFFRERVPEDWGHLPEPYFPHVLRGLRRELPAYVRDALAHNPSPDLTARLRGLVVVAL